MLFETFNIIDSSVLFPYIFFDVQFHNSEIVISITKALIV